MIRVAFIIGDYPPEERRLREEVAKSYSTPEVEVGILSVKPSPFGGLSPAEIQLVEFRAQARFPRWYFDLSALRRRLIGIAQRQLWPGHFIDG